MAEDSHLLYLVNLEETYLGTDASGGDEWA